MLRHGRDMRLHDFKDEEVVLVDGPAIMQPTREGVNSRTVCQPRVMMLLWPAQREDTSTMGPGSRYRRTWLTGKSRFSGCFGIGILSRAALCSDAPCSGEVSRAAL